MIPDQQNEIRISNAAEAKAEPSPLEMQYHEVSQLLDGLPNVDKNNGKDEWSTTFKKMSDDYWAMTERLDWPPDTDEEYRTRTEPKEFTEARHRIREWFQEYAAHYHQNFIPVVKLAQSLRKAIRARVIDFRDAQQQTTSNPREDGLIHMMAASGEHEWLSRAHDISAKVCVMKQRFWDVMTHASIMACYDLQHDLPKNPEQNRQGSKAEQKHPRTIESKTNYKELTCDEVIEWADEFIKFLKQFNAYRDAWCKYKTKATLQRWDSGAGVNSLCHDFTDEFYDLETSMQKQMSDMARQCDHPLFSFTKDPGYMYMLEAPDDELDYLVGDGKERPPWTPHEEETVHQLLAELRLQFPAWDKLLNQYFEMKELLNDSRVY